MSEVFYFDADCGLCTKSAQLLGNLVDPKVQLIGTFPEDPQVPAVIAYEIEQHVVANLDAKTFFGHEAIGQVLRKHGRWIAVRLVGNLLCASLLGGIWAAIYKQVAANRQKLSLIIGATACRR